METDPPNDPHAPHDPTVGERHWRSVAEEQTAELQRIKRRLLVRIALRLDRTIEPATISVRRTVLRVRGAAGSAAVTAAAMRPGVRRQARRARLTPAVGEADMPAGRHVSYVRANGVAALAEAARAAEADVLCFAPRRIDSLAPDSMARLVHAVDGDVVAATPTLVHPARPLARATEHDSLVRSEGLAIDLDAKGVPVIRARNAGGDVALAGPVRDVAAAPLQCLVVDRAAYFAAGGLVAVGDEGEDEAAAELCIRLRKAGGRVVHVPGSVVVDDRPVKSRAALRAPIDVTGAPWRKVIERHGPWLVRRSRRGTGPSRWVITTAAPSLKVAPQWGDTHLAEALADALRRRGRDVFVQSHDQAESGRGRSCDFHLVVRGLGRVPRTPGQHHLLWLISHPEAVDLAECDEADLVLVASDRFAANLQQRTSTPVEVMLQATDPARFYPREPDPAHQHPITVVAKSRGVMRTSVADALAAGLRPAIYGSGWEGLVGPSLVVTAHVDNEVLPVVYSSAGVVLNDHWDTMRAWGFVSNRIYDVLACGTPVVSDPVDDLDTLFEGAVPSYVGSDELRAVVTEILGDPAKARARAARGRELVLARHTFDHRVDHLLALVDRYELSDPPG